MNDVNVELSVTIPGSELGTMDNNYLLAGAKIVDLKNMYYE